MSKPLKFERDSAVTSRHGLHTVSGRQCTVILESYPDPTRSSQTILKHRRCDWDPLRVSFEDPSVKRKNKKRDGGKEGCEIVSKMCFINHTQKITNTLHTKQHELHIK